MTELLQMNTFVLLLAGLITSVTSMTIQATSTEQLIPLQVSGLLECQYLYSVSANPPFVVLCQDVIVAAGNALNVLDLQAHEGHRTHTQGPPKSSETGVSKQNPPMPLDAVDKVKRQSFSNEFRPIEGMELYTPYSFLSSSRLVSRGSDSELKRYEEQVSELYASLQRLRTQVTQDPVQLETLYPRLKSKYVELKASLTAFTVEGLPANKDILGMLERASILCEMLDLNRAMRLLGCGEYLNLVSVEDPKNPGTNRSVTRLSIFTERLQTFADSMLTCYDDEGQPRIHDEGFEEKVASVFLEFDTLQAQSHDFMIQDTPLSKIFWEDLMAIEWRLTDLTISARAKTIHASLPSVRYKAERAKKAERAEREERAATPSPNDHNRPSGSVTDEDKQSLVLEEMQEKLAHAYENNPQEAESLDLEEYCSWRDNLHYACDEVYLLLAKCKFPGHPEKKKTKALLDELTHELSSKVNSVLLVATSMTADARAPDLVTLGNISELLHVIRSDVLFVEGQLEHLLECLDKVVQENTSEDNEPCQDLSTIKTRFDRLSQYLSAVEWAKLPYADDIRQMQTEIARIIEEQDKGSNCSLPV